MPGIGRLKNPTVDGCPGTTTTLRWPDAVNHFTSLPTSRSQRPPPLRPRVVHSLNYSIFSILGQGLENQQVFIGASKSLAVLVCANVASAPPQTTALMVGVPPPLHCSACPACPCPALCPALMCGVFTHVLFRVNASPESTNEQGLGRTCACLGSVH